MAAAPDPPALTINDAFEVLEKLGAKQLEKLILVGGQAAAFWIARYGVADPGLVTTKDIDMLVSGRQPGLVVACARDLSGALLVVKEPRAPDIARVRFAARGAELQVDFLRSLHGISASDVVSSKLAVVDERVAGKTLYVMHPVLALASRLFNTFELPGRLMEENLSRLRLSIDAARAYLNDQLSTAVVRTKDVLPSIERTFSLATCGSGLRAWHDQRIDLSNAVPNKSDLSKCPPQFLERRYPQLLRELESKRKAASKPRPPSKSTKATKH
jgi:hypothetical protein